MIIEDTANTNGKDKSGAEGASNEASNFAEETLMSDREMRDFLLNDIVEGSAFIKRRLQELKGSEQATFTTYEEHNKPAILQANDNIEFLTSVDQNLQQAYQILTSKRLYMLLNLKHNPT